MRRTLSFYIAALLIAALALPVGAADIRSVYTDLTDKTCDVTAAGNAKKGHGDRRSLRCPGVQGYQLDVVEDLSQQRLVGIVKNGKVQELNASVDSRLGRQAEWRVQGQKPIALIIRVYVEMDEPREYEEKLMVTKISPSQSCVIKWIDARKEKDANVLARAAADDAQAMSCL